MVFRAEIDNVVVLAKDPCGTLGFVVTGMMERCIRHPVHIGVSRQFTSS